MGNRWGGELPPDEAYSQVTRDLATVTIAYARWLDGLAGRLERSYECTVEGATEYDRSRFSRGVDRAYVVRPASPASAPLVVGRGRYEGGAFAEFGLGAQASELVPVCFCDACDEDSEGMIEDARSVVVAVTGGFEEWHRWPAPPSRRHDPAAGQISSGYRSRQRGRASYETPSGGQPAAYPGVPAAPRSVDPPETGAPAATDEREQEAFHVTWRPWTLRT